MTSKAEGKVLKRSEENSWKIGIGRNLIRDEKDLRQTVSRRGGENEEE